MNLKIQTLIASICKIELNIDNTMLILYQCMHDNINEVK